MESYKDTKEFRQQFLTDRDESGRFYVTSFRTGRKYFVEPIGPNRTADWGSYNPSTGNIENKKGNGKFRGSIDEDNSMITPENGFDPNEIHMVHGGSPFAKIEELDSKYPDKNEQEEKPGMVN